MLSRVKLAGYTKLIRQIDFIISSYEVRLYSLCTVDRLYNVKQHDSIRHGTILYHCSTIRLKNNGTWKSDAVTQCLTILRIHNLSPTHSSCKMSLYLIMWNYVKSADRNFETLWWLCRCVQLEDDCNIFILWETARSDADSIYMSPIKALCKTSLSVCSWIIMS